MNWMKHYSKAELGLRIQNAVNNMGYFGVALYWILCRYINSRHQYKRLDEYNFVFTSSERKVSPSPIYPSDTKEKSTSLEPVFHNEPTLLQPSVLDEPTSQQPSVRNEPTSRQPSVHDEPNPPRDIGSDLPRRARNKERL